MPDVHAFGSRRLRAPWRALVAVLTAIFTVLAPSYLASQTAEVGLATRQLELIGQQPISPTGSEEQVLPAIVQIDTRTNYQGVIGTGAGIVLDPGGTVLTNNHVVAGADDVSATVGGRTFDAELLGYDRQTDIAVIQLLGAGGLSTAPYGDSSRLSLGEPVVSLGNADGTAAPPTRQPGTITGLNENIEAVDELTGATEQLTGLIESSARIMPGDSGGALVNGAGQIIGVNVAASANYRLSGGQGFSIPIIRALGVANQIRTRTPSDTVHIGGPAMLGVGVSTAAPRPGAPPGVVLRDVLVGTPADEAGLAPGDRITAINEFPIDSPTRLTNVLDRFYPGNVVTVAWVDRSGAPRAEKVTLAAGPNG